MRDRGVATGWLWGTSTPSGTAPRRGSGTAPPPAATRTARIVAVGLGTAGRSDADPDQTIRILARETGRPGDAIRATRPGGRLSRGIEITDAPSPG